MNRLETASDRRPHTGSALVRVAGLALLLAGAAFAAWKFGLFDYRHALEHVARVRRSHSFPAFAIGFALIYGAATSIGLPGLPFTVAAGALFGTLLGVALSWVGAMLGAVGGYWIARTVGRDAVGRSIRRFKRADAALQQARDFGGMFRLRLVPVLPLGTINFIGGLSGAPFWPYILATAVGIIPSLSIYAYFADSLLEGVGSGGRRALFSLTIASALLIVLSLAPRMFSRNRAARR